MTTNSYSHLMVKLGLPADAEIHELRQGIYDIPAHSAILKIEDTPDVAGIQNQLDIVNGLSGSAPVLGSLNMTAVSDGSVTATLWPRAETLGSRGKLEDYEAFGQCLVDLRVTPAYCRSYIPRFNQLDKLRRRIDLLRSLDMPQYALDYLEDAVIEIASHHDQIANSGDSLIHGDAYLGNLVKLDGVYKLIDLDELCYGPWQYDFIPTAVEAIRCGYHQEFEALQTVLDGDDIRYWEHFYYACRLRELTMTTWLGTFWTSGTDLHRQEFITRVDTLINDDYDTLWRVF